MSWAERGGRRHEDASRARVLGRAAAFRRHRQPGDRNTEPRRRLRTEGWSAAGRSAPIGPRREQVDVSPVSGPSRRTRTHWTIGSAARRARPPAPGSRAGSAPPDRRAVPDDLQLAGSPSAARAGEGDLHASPAGARTSAAASRIAAASPRACAAGGDHFVALDAPRGQAAREQERDAQEEEGPSTTPAVGERAARRRMRV